MPKKIWIVGLGPGDYGALSARTLELMQRLPVFLRTERHPAVAELAGRGVAFFSFDDLYEGSLTFEQVYTTMVDRLLALDEAEIVYAVPGHPLVAETSVQMLLARARDLAVDTEILPAPSCLEAVCQVLGLDLARGIVILDGLEIRAIPLAPHLGCLILQVYSPLVASEVKLALMEVYPDTHPVRLVRAAGVPGGERVVQIPLYEIDRQKWLDHLTTVYVPPYPAAVPATRRMWQPSRRLGTSLAELADVMATLRGPGGCPWDREQTHASLRRYLIEETYEVIEAIDAGEPHKLKEELGDLLLQIVFHAQLAQEEGTFTLEEVIHGIIAKMQHRHPHVFGDLSLNTSQEVLARWDDFKKAENGDRALMDLPPGLPALLKAQKVQEKAARVGFDWPDAAGPWKKVREEARELQAAVAGGRSEDVQDELGDYLFAVVNVGRHLGVDVEATLSLAVDKFRRRFAFIEEQAARNGKALGELSLEEMDAWWEQAKIGES
ncbi:MAG: nucleoside triphosphate pyrophosphohydrolase [Clostridia bacterium]|nr:MAG: nucleoside triphosphate pyrophosphohydrolase [Clostridia bacterium]